MLKFLSIFKQPGRHGPIRDGKRNQQQNSLGAELPHNLKCDVTPAKAGVQIQALGNNLAVTDQSVTEKESNNSFGVTVWTVIPRTEF